MSEYVNNADQPDLLDGLLRQSEALDQKLRPHYPDIFSDVPSAPVASSAGTIHEEDESLYFSPMDETLTREASDSSCHDSEPDPVKEIDEQSLQMYALRRKYEDLPAHSLWETAMGSQTNPEKRTSCAPDALSDEELFLYAVTRLAGGIMDEATYAMAQMEHRNGNGMLAFLPVYTALDSGYSHEKMSRLLSQPHPAFPSDSDPCAALTALSRQMLSSVVQVISDAEALQEAGYRNRQDALRAAAAKAQQRVDSLRKRTY